MTEDNVFREKDRAIESEMKRAFIDYSMSVIMSRALPDVRDGLKPVHRRVLYAMYDMGLTYNKTYKKSARVVGECFTKDTMVLTSKGLLPIQQVKRGDAVYTQDDIKKVSELYVMPKKDLLKVTLENGIENKVTKSQKFKILTRDWTFEWKQANELNENDVIVVKHAYPNINKFVKLSNEQKTISICLDEDIAYLLGIFLSDGWISKDYGKKKHSRVCFYGGTNKEIAERVSEIVQRVFEYKPTIEKKTYTHKPNHLKYIYYVRMNRKEINDFFVSNFNIADVNACSKQVPLQLFYSPKPVIFSFISGLIDGDGSIHPKRNAIHYGSISEKMINQIQILLQSNGIFASKYVSDKRDSKHLIDEKTITDRHQFFYLEITGQYACDLGKSLDVVHKRKRVLLKKISDEIITKRDAWSKFDVIPYAGSKVFGELSDYHIGGGWYQSVTGEKFRSGISYPTGCKIRYSSDLQSKPLHMNQINQWGIKKKLKRIGSDVNAFLEYVVENNLAFLRVASIQSIEPEKTYDIQVESDHEFVANGMVSHNCLGKYHPHGDQSVYDTMVRMAQDFSLRYQLVDGQGNFGSVDGDSAAAMRYTEAKMAKISQLMLDDIKKDTVDWIDNFDGSLKEPVVLPAKLPNLLINGSSGIAVGMATNMPPHNLSEVVDGLVRIIDDPFCSVPDLMEDIIGPDFPTGGIIYGKGGILKAYTTGKGLIKLRARTEMEEKNKRKRIIVTEIPYQVNKSKLLLHIADLVKLKRIEGISDLRDESDRNGMRIVIELKRDAIEDVVLNQLYTHTQLQTTFGINNLALVDGEPKFLGLREMLQHYVDYRVEVITRKTTYELNKAKDRMHILEGLMIALDHIDAVIALIRKSKDASEAQTGLMNEFELSEKQAKAILDMRLQKLTGLEIESVKTEFEEVKQLIEQLELLLSDKQHILDEIKQELLEMKDTFGDDRRSEIVEGEITVETEDLIPVQDVIVTITDSGYIKRISCDTYRVQRRGGKGLIGIKTKEEDVVVDSFMTSTHDYIMFFTNHGKAFWLKGYKIPEGGRHAKGKAIVNLLPRLDENEYVQTAIPVHEFDDEHFLVFATKNGLIKKTVLSAYQHVRVNGIRAVKIEEGDELVGTRLSDGSQTIMLATAEGQACRFDETEVRAMGRVTRGVIGVRLHKDDRVVSIAIVGEEGDLLTITENGFGKRTAISEYRKTHRGSKGVRTIITNERNGQVIFVRELTEDDEIMLTSREGMVVRIPVKGIRLQGRNTMGVRVMRLNEGDTVVSVAQVVSNEDEEEDDSCPTAEQSEDSTDKKVVEKSTEEEDQEENT